MHTHTQRSWIAFAQSTCIASGAPRMVAETVKHFMDAHPHAAILIFDEATSLPIELDLRGNLNEVLERLPEPQQPQASAEPAPQPAGRGRPKLGVVAREVTLLPRHWEWLATQPGGASVALRKLVEQARRASTEVERRRQAQEAAYRFMGAMAGNEAGFEEATRALFAGDLDRLRECVEQWPLDVRNHALRLAETALHQNAETGENCA